jgi:uracil phosphoribosyltransferase
MKRIAAADTDAFRSVGTRRDPCPSRPPRRMLRPAVRVGEEAGARLTGASMRTILLGPLRDEEPSVPEPAAPGTSTLPDPVRWPRFHVSQHPAVLHKLAILRDERTEPKKFREIVRELSWLLGYEALADVATRPLRIRTPMEEMEADELGVRIGFVPILRAGLGMVDAMLELMPTAEVWHLGLFRDERTLRPVEYYNKLPDSATVDLSLILDPMLATGGSATAAIEVLKRWGAARIKLVNLIAAPEGVDAVTAAHPDVDMHCAALDRQLNERGYIMPGLGDAGDRQFGTAR